MEKPCIFSADEIRTLASEFPTPFYLYDEATIRNACQTMKNAFSWAPNFKNYFAVKATPNPKILEILKDEGCGADCSSMAELLLSNATGLKNEDIMFTSNNTPLEEFIKAKELGAIINLDDESHLDFLYERAGLPDLICFRYNPGALREGNTIIGDPASSKFGVTTEQLGRCYQRARDLGVKRFALHTMIVSNCLEEDELVTTGRMLFELAVMLKETYDIRLEFVNLGGGIGIPYEPSKSAINIESLSSKIKQHYDELIVKAGLDGLGIVYECGRYITGPSGVLVTRAIHQKDIYKRYIGVDANINSLMRPALYGSYHHITVVRENENSKALLTLPTKRSLFMQNYQQGDTITFDVVGSLCENNDKLAIDRILPADLHIGDILVFHDTGAHGHAMGFNYNGKLRIAEYIKKDTRRPVSFLKRFLPTSTHSKDGSVVMIRKQETYKDLFTTLRWCGKLPGKTLWDCPFTSSLLLVSTGLACGFVLTRLFSRKRN